MNNHNKFFKALFILKPNVEATLSTENDEITETDFNNVKWNTGEDNGQTITTTTNPHSEITWDLVSAEMDKLQIEYDAQEYARNRKAEYPTIEECIHAILDDDLENLQILRQVVKDKFPKENA